jgi:hypothetical protein
VLRIAEYSRSIHVHVYPWLSVLLIITFVNPVAFLYRFAVPLDSFPGVFVHAFTEVE